MPNWKKLIVSGSDAALLNLNVTNAVTASAFVGDGSGLTGISATPFVTTPLSLTSNFTTEANTFNILKSLASDPFTIEDGIVLTITATSIVQVEEV